MNKPKIIGLTGGIGSGKTTVAKMFKKLGVPIFIADIEAKRLMNECAELKQKIISIFGEQAYQNQQLNRKYIGKQVFKDEELLNKLNEVVHPAVQDVFELWHKNQNASYVLYEAAILLEKGRASYFDKIILVVASERERIRRIKTRDGASEAHIKERMNNQWNDDKKRKFADFVIKNDILEKTKEKVFKIHKLLEIN